MADSKNDNRSRETERELIEVSRLTDEQLFEKYKTDPEGLNQVEAAERLEEYGRNIIDVSNENSEEYIDIFATARTVSSAGSRTPSSIRSILY